MKKLVLIIFAILILISAVVFYFYNRISYTPDWYNSNEYRVGKQVVAQAKGTTKRIDNELTNGTKSAIDEEELNSLIIEKMDVEFPGQTNQFIKAFRSDIQPDNITVETIVDLDHLPLERLPVYYQKTIREFINTFPKGSRQNFYIQISGKPVLQNGQVQLDQDAKIYLGKMEYPLSSVLKQIAGNHRLEAFIPLSELPFKNFHLEEDKIVLEN